jgi:TRAP-type C4-dicarboxylate transport system substrate-binding protein
MRVGAALLCGASLVAATAAAHAGTTLTFAGSDAIGSIIDKQNLRFTACVNAKGGDRLKVSFIQGEQLGNDVQVIEQMMQGSVQLYGDVLDWYSNWVKDYAVLAWGFTFRDADHLQKFLDSPAYAAMAEKLRKEQGLRVLAAAPTQPRILFTRKPVASLADLTGVKMRVPEIRTYLALWTLLGTRPSRLAWGEVYLGLKTGVVEAAEGPVSSAYSARLHEAAPHVLRTDHLMSSTHITVNDQAYAALAPDLQKLLVDCAQDAVQNTRRMAQQETDDVVKRMAAEGARIGSVDLAPIRQRAKDGAAKMEKEGAWSAGLWDRIQKL